MRPSRGRGYTGSRYPTRALIGALSEVIDGAQGDTWPHLDATMKFDWRKPHNHKIMAHDHEIVAHDRLIGESSKLAIATLTHDKPSTFIKRLLFQENVDRVMGHNSYSVARSDDVDHIAKWKAHIARGISLIKIDVSPLFFLTLD